MSFHRLELDGYNPALELHGIPMGEVIADGVEQWILEPPLAILLDNIQEACKSCLMGG
jgi:hypothetical protein